MLFTSFKLVLILHSIKITSSACNNSLLNIKGCNKSDKIFYHTFHPIKTPLHFKYYNMSPNKGLTSPPTNDITGPNKANKASNIFFTSHKSVFDFI